VKHVKADAFAKSKYLGNASIIISISRAVFIAGLSSAFQFPGT
jgi:hypothetical protein